MSSKIKNIIILVVVAVVLVLVYIFFIKKAPENASLTSSSGVPATGDVSTTTPNDETTDISSGFISLLLSVKSIKLDDSILKDQAFLSLRDSSITLVQDGNEGRPNPFAPIGSESVTPPTDSTVPTVPVDSSSLSPTTSGTLISPTPTTPITPTTPKTPTSTKPKNTTP